MSKLKENTAKTKNKLPHGAIKELSKRSNKSYDTVRRVLSGHSMNECVIRSLEEYLEEINKRRLSITTHIQRLKSHLL